VSSPVALAGTRDAGDDSSVLELADVTGADAVGPASPLVVRVPGRIADDESMVAVVWDGEFWVPVGHTADRAADHTDLAIVTLPTTAAAGGDTKDLVGSVAIVIRKLVGRRLGLSYPWPRLAVATVVDGDVRYDADRDAVAAAVSRASSVLLYVHGIVGDTRGQVRHGAASGLDDLYDVVLAFDYENLHTRIEENADALEDALTAVGLGPGSGKVVDVVAHSMGGLVTRWFVERGRGKEMVSRVVLAGTPSGGSPWSQIQDWATAALGIGLNGLGLSLAWPAAVVTGLAGLVERVDNSLDQMHVGSPFVSDLKRLADPRIPYTVLIGDRSVAPDTATRSLLGRLRLRATDAVSALAFLGEPNDIAVTVTSATGLPSGRSPESAVVRLGCDHMTYFSTEAGQAALRAALRKER
jgi:pimeloyl-ACP methyl ester carboxylesterase